MIEEPGSFEGMISSPMPDLGPEVFPLALHEVAAVVALGVDRVAAQQAGVLAVHGERMGGRLHCRLGHVAPWECRAPSRVLSAHVGVGTQGSSRRARPVP